MIAESKIDQDPWGFPKLPIELHLRIWKYALPDSRIVGLVRRPLRITMGEWEDQEGCEWPPVPTGHGKQSLRKLKIEADFLDEHKNKLMPGCPHWNESSTRRENKGNNSCSCVMPKEPYRLANISAFHSDCEIPNILLINHESHEVARCHYNRMCSEHGIAPTSEFRAQHQEFHLRNLNVPGVWFNFDLDVLHLHYEEFFGERDQLEMLKAMKRIPSETRNQVRNLAVSLKGGPNVRGIDGDFLQHIIKIIFPHLASLQLIR